MLKTERTVFSPKSTKTLVNYFVEDSHLYSYDWELITPERQGQIARAVKAVHERMLRRAGRK